MDVQLPPELEDRIVRIAAQEGRDTAKLVQEALERYADYDEWFLDAVNVGVEQADRGELIEHDDVVARIEKRILDSQRPS